MDQRVKEALQAIQRAKFVRLTDRPFAGVDKPLSIGHGQTISQPYTVGKMLEWLDVQPGQNILDVGSGSGWTTALLSHLVGSNGHVTAVELISELVEFGRKNCAKIPCENVEFHQAGEVYGWPANAPYERILVSASARELPDDLIEQLGPNGKIVIPIRDSIYEITKRPGGTLETRKHPGFVFVPLLPN